MDVKFHLRNKYAKPDPVITVIPFRDIHCHVARGVYENSDPEQWFTVTLDKVPFTVHVGYRHTNTDGLDECNSSLRVAAGQGIVPPFLSARHKLDALLDVRVSRALSLLILDLVTAVPSAHFFNLLADFIPGSLAALIVLGASLPSRRVSCSYTPSCL
jgi:hypothetical protein